MLQMQRKIESIIAEQMDVVHDRASINEEEDRISNLPDEIIHRILSFFDMKYAIQTSTLSKKWKHIWCSMPYLNLNSRTFRNMPEFAKFVKQALSHRNHRTQVSAVELSFTGSPAQIVVRSVVKYAYSHNVSQLTLIGFSLSRIIRQFPECLFSSHTLKHLTLATNHSIFLRCSCIPNSAWDFPALETLCFRYIKLSDDRGDKSLNLFSKCVNLKDLTLHGCDMRALDVFNVCAPQLSNLTILGPFRFPKVFNMVAPKLESLTASVLDIFYNFLQLSVEDLDSLEKVNLSMQPLPSEEEKYARGLLDLFQKLGGAKFLILDNGIIKVLSKCMDQPSLEPCPFNNLKCLKIDTENNPLATITTQVRNYLLESSPSASFIMDIPQVSKKRYREEVDEGTMAKKVSNVIKVQQEKSREEVDKSTMAEKALPSCTDRPSHEPSPFNNLECLNQTDCIPRMPIEVNSQLLESSPSGTFNMDLPEVPHNRSGQEAVNGTMASTLDKEKQQTKTMDEENRMLEAKIVMQDELIAEKKAKLEAMEVQNEKRMLEAKILMQDKIIAHQKLEEKMKMQDKVIAEQKVMLETMRLQNEMKMFEAKILSQDKIISEQKAMLEAMKLQHENIETQLGNIDS